MTIKTTLPLTIAFSLLIISTPAISIETPPQQQSKSSFISGHLLQKNLNEDQFIQLVSKRYKTSYRFMKQLSKEDKATIYQSYQKDADFSEIRKQIFDLFFKFPRENSETADAAQDINEHPNKKKAKRVGTDISPTVTLSNTHTIAPK